MKICLRRASDSHSEDSKEMLHYLRVAPHQLAPNALRTFFAYVILWPKVLEEGNNLLVREFLKIYKLTKNPNAEYIFNFQIRQKAKFILLTGYSSNKGWKKEILLHLR
jgi:hypothetical protein